MEAKQIVMAIKNGNSNFEFHIRKWYIKMKVKYSEYIWIVYSLKLEHPLDKTFQECSVHLATYSDSKDFD